MQFKDKKKEDNENLNLKSLKYGQIEFIPNPKHNDVYFV